MLVKVNPLNCDSKSPSPAQQLAQALFESVGKPRHMFDQAGKWRQIAHQILSDEKYQIKNVLGAIKWFPTNKFWSSRITDMELFKDNLDRILSEYHASLMQNRRKRYEFDLNGTRRKEAIDAVIAKETCEVCNNERILPGEHWQHCDPTTCKWPHTRLCPRCNEVDGTRRFELWNQLSEEEIYENHAQALRSTTH